MLLPLDTPQGIADTLGYLQHHLQELTERQYVSESNINVRATGHKTPGESSVVLQSVVMIQLTSRRILRD